MVRGEAKPVPRLCLAAPEPSRRRQGFHVQTIEAPTRLESHYKVIQTVILTAQAILK